MGTNQKIDQDVPETVVDDYRSQFLIEMYRQMWATQPAHLGRLAIRQCLARHLRSVRTGRKANRLLDLLARSS